MNPSVGDWVTIDGIEYTIVRLHDDPRLGEVAEVKGRDVATSVLTRYLVWHDSRKEWRLHEMADR